MTGASIGGVFGAIWLIASANTPLGSSAAVAFRTLGILGFVAFAIGRRRAAQQQKRPDTSASHGVNLCGRAYWRIVAGEFALLAIGFAAFAAAGAPTEVYRPWTAIVVAIHFVAFRLADVWQGSGVWPVVPLLVVGVAGLALAYTSAANWVALVTGVGAGLTLLGGSLRVMAHDALDPNSVCEPADDELASKQPTGQRWQAA